MILNTKSMPRLLLWISSFSEDPDLVHSRIFIPSLSEEREVYHLCIHSFISLFFCCSFGVKTLIVYHLESVIFRMT